DAAQKRAFLDMQFRAQHQFYHERFSQASFQLILRDGHPIGRLYVDRREDEIRIIDIAILPEHRNAGIGGVLLRALLSEAGEVGKPVRIHVEHYNRAMTLYQRLGFVPISEQGVHILMEWSPNGRSPGTDG
ncbi:MAG TPA: GNAT family N-acetyltransferase, partial [Isosphaeraceae bacterium]|nr:GNAT family N-acetyltransferase [Isosphaeraceae bacterium]